MIVIGADTHKRTHTVAWLEAATGLIDAVAIARAALREGLDTLPVARLAGPELDVRLLVDHRERLVAQRTALSNDLRWHLHDLWPETDIPPRALTATS
jgi:transposase